MNECANCGRWVAAWITFSATDSAPENVPPPLTVCQGCFQSALDVFGDLVEARWVQYAPGEADARAALQAAYRPS